jgi:hypothetical protein
MEKPAPLIIKQDSIGLQSIAYLLAGGAVLFLQSYCLFKKIDAHQRRFTPLPGKARNWKTQPHIIFNKFIEYLIAHSLSALAELRRSFLVKTVSAINIAI